MQAQHQVENQFHARAISSGAQPEDAFCKKLQKITAGIQCRRIAACHNNGVSGVYLRARAAYRSVKICDSLGGALPSNLRHFVRISRRHIQYNPGSRRYDFPQYLRADGRVRKREADASAGVKQLLHAASTLDTLSRDGIQPARVQIEDDDATSAA